MNNIDMVKAFFADLELWEDMNNSKEHKQKIEAAIYNFIEKCDFETAFEVYKSFFEAYYIGTQVDINPFVQLIEKMRSYEEKAGALLNSHRDHYCHSVYVFILGLSIYKNNISYQEIFNLKALDKTEYKDSYNTKEEEFFFRWGVASLFHDIAYPLEITLKQIQVYTSFLTTYSDTLYDMNITLKIDNLDDFNKLKELPPMLEYSEKFKANYPNYKEFALTDSIDILSYNISKSLNLEFKKVRQDMITYLDNMLKNNRIDHGYFSALILLKWYHKLFENTKWNPAYFYFPIADAATSILLHNYYRHGLMKSELALGKLDARSNPLAFLLILCDELQDWNRKAYGQQDEGICKPTGFNISINNNLFELTYIFSEGGEDIDYVAKRMQALDNVISSEAIFYKGVQLYCCRKDDDFNG